MKNRTPAINIRAFSAWLSLIVLTPLWVLMMGATLDDFNRPDGPVGPQWLGGGANLQVSGNQLKATSYTSAVYDLMLGKNQMVSGIWAAIGGSEQDLLLKAQGAPGAHIEVRYDHNTRLMRVAAYNYAWVNYVQWPCTMVPGDTMTAACDSLGMVTVWRNSIEMGSVSVSSWPYATLGGRVGITMGTAPRLDVIAAGDTKTQGPLNDPALNLSLSWTWPNRDEMGYHETSLRYARIWYRDEAGESHWDGNLITTGAPIAPDTLQRAFVAMPWSWFNNRPTRFMVTVIDTMGNEGPPGNEVVKSP